MKLKILRGNLVSTISPLAVIGNLLVVIGKGSNIMQNSTISSSVTIGDGCLIYYGSKFAHGFRIDTFVSILPNATILGRVNIGSFTQIESSATI